MVVKSIALKNVFFYNTELEIVDVFTYLGFNFKYNGKFDCIQNSIATQAKKCFFLTVEKG